MSTHTTSTRSLRTRVTKGLGGLGLTGALLGATLAPVSADTQSEEPYDGPETLLINEVYTQGGEPGSTYLERYVELYNYGTEDIDLAEWSLQYTNAAGSFHGDQNLQGTVPAGGHFLIAFEGAQAADGEYTLVDYADFDATNDWFHTSDYTLLLAPQTDRITMPEGSVEVTDYEEIVDLIGYGSAYAWAGEAAAPAGNEVEDAALQRVTSWEGPSAENSTDFAPTEEFEPVNSSGEPYTPTPTDPDAPGAPEDGEEVRISEIRGENWTDSFESPLEGEDVMIAGFVTAKYDDAENDSRAHDGFYVQEEAACGEGDYTDHQVSCAIFVHQGTSWDGAGVEIGDYVEITGTVGTWNETGAQESAQLQILNGAVIEVAEPEDGVTEPVPYVYEGFLSAEEREHLIGMLIEPAGDWAISDNYGLLHGEPDSVGGVLRIVDGTEPHYTATHLMAPGAEADAHLAENQAREITLGHGGRNRWASFAFDRHMPLPYLQSNDTVRIGAALTWTDHVILEYRYDGWRFEPTSFLPGNPEAEPVEIQDTRSGAVLPERAGDLRLAGFNVLNYFPHLGEDEPGCDYHEDRHGNPTTADWCDVRGAYTEAHFQVQQARIVNTIVEMDADIVALQEIENSSHFGEDRDYAHQVLVEALNAAEGDEAWDFVPVDEHPEDEDVIRNGFVYKPANVELVDSLILFEDGVAALDSDALEGYDLADIYSNAREPMAAVFQPVGGTDTDQFVTIVNHFKSKSCSGAEGANQDQGDGQACFNADRTAQAEAQVAFTEAIRDDRGIENFYLMGDFNSHAYEDPMRAIYDAEFGDYQNLSLGQDGYHFGGELGALDHILASGSAAETVEQTVIWNTNAREPIALEYSRYEASGTEGIYGTETWGSMVWRASDHDPIIADIALEAEPTDRPSEDPTDDQTTPPAEAPTDDPTGTPTEEPTEPEDFDEGSEGGLARTGAAIGAVLGGALLLVLLGLILHHRARRSSQFTD
ncbi:ExeM/NucH family extracellular endonuclease [Nesterenkonia ebinurensis]|uniref:ExeM/NucH family extracellular endonuclease n=1 Tax=Nesterenkonia ebinurensis TaxID=2608252 RepID=UPI00123D141A|nr:ExeM/NucH family extracellular endonuclease [Nesterenkonia ebinurensis]